MAAVDIKIGARIRAARERHGVRQEDLAAAIGKPRGFVAHLENGRRTISCNTLIDVARALGITPGLLLAGIG